MLRPKLWIALAAAATLSAATASAQPVLDAVYRGTLVCDRLPFMDANMREAIDVTISAGTVRYTHVVRLRNAADTAPEAGTGTLVGNKLSLQGSWKGGNREYTASYGGTFVRRSAKLRGKQTWSDGGKTFSRDCSGAIKRPLKVFLPRNRAKPAAQ